MDYKTEQNLIASQRELSPEAQSYYVCYMGLLDYQILAVFDTEDSAEAALEKLAREHMAKNRPQFVHQAPGKSLADYQVRQQWDLDALVRAIRSTYR